MTEKLFIWGESIPGNSKKSKTDVLDIHPEYTMEDLFEKYPGIWDKSTDHLGDLSGNDTMVFRQEIEQGPGKITYEDQPFLVPYLVEGSEQAVILYPGGAYLTKSMVEEGEDIAQVLNQAGISAFVLWYRSYPYRAPIMFLDAQRAIRYVRYHAKTFGINPEKIALAGFSAGGNLAGVTAYILRNKEVEVDCYQPDAIDVVSAHVNATALIYPAIHLEGDKIVAVMGGRDTYENEGLREEFAQSYDMRNYLEELDAPLFICAAMDDDVVSANYCLELAQKAHKKGIATDLHLFSVGGHGFGAGFRPQHPKFAKDRTLVRDWLSLLIAWLRFTL